MVGWGKDGRGLEAGISTPPLHLALADPMLSGEGSESTYAEGARTPNVVLTMSAAFTTAPIEQRTNAGMDVEPVFLMTAAR